MQWLEAYFENEEGAGMINKHNAWVMFAMFLFFITKMTALICATIIAIQGNIWIGTLLFLAAIVFRITWTYIPDVEKQKVRDDITAAHGDA